MSRTKRAALYALLALLLAALALWASAAQGVVYAAHLGGWQ